MTNSVTYADVNGPIEAVVVTDSRETAAQYIERGYTLFTVPQMFGVETGVIVLCLEQEAQSQKANRMSREDAIRVLEDYEKASRNHSMT